MNAQVGKSPIDTTKVVAFVGGGNMAQAIIGGLLAEGLPATMIRVAEPLPDVREFLAVRGVSAYERAVDAVHNADVVVLAVKPQIIQVVLGEIAPLVANKLVISIAAGISLATLSAGLNGHQRIVRAMPNTPALVQTGATGLYAEASLSDVDRQRATTILSATGLTLWVHDEALMHAVTAVSGSGPAYFFYLMEAMIAAGVAQGLDERTAKALTLQTALGAAQMAISSEDSPTRLRQKVTSPNGTTAAAIEYLDQHDVHAQIVAALGAAARRSEALSAS